MSEAPVPAPFSWRREWPFLLLPLAAALLARLPAGRLASELYFNSDGAAHLLAAKHWSEGGLPLVMYGQSYIGTLESALAAPFHAWLGPDPWVWVPGNALLYCLLALPIYRLCHGLGGRPGAILGAVALCLGTHQMLENLGGTHSSYHATLLWGALLVLAAPRFLQAPGPGRAIGVGLLAGLAWWTNPQIATFIAPVALVLFLQGRTCVLLREGGGALGRAIGPPGLVWAARAAYVALIATCALSLWLSFAGGVETRVLGLQISLTKPEIYLVRAAAAAGAFLFLLEFWLSRERRRLAAVTLAFGLGFAAGFSPQAVHRLREGPGEGKKAPIGLSPRQVAPNTRELFSEERLGYVLANLHRPPRLEEIRLEALPGPLPALGRLWAPHHARVYLALRRALLAALLVSVLGFLWLERRAFLALATLRPVPPTPGFLLALQAAAILALCLLYPRQLENRYLLQLWVPFAALLAGACGVLWRVHRLAGGTFLALAIGFYLLAVPTNAAALAAEHRGFLNHDPLLLASVHERGVERGWANYWVGFKLAYLSGERIVFAPLPHKHGQRFEAYARLAREARETVWIFEVFRADGHRPIWLDEQALASFLAGAEADGVVERWRIGPFVLYRVSELARGTRSR